MRNAFFLLCCIRNTMMTAAECGYLINEHLNIYAEIANTFLYNSTEYDQVQK